MEILTNRLDISEFKIDLHQDLIIIYRKRPFITYLCDVYDY